MPLRIAVPDGLFPDQSYIDKVKPGGTGAGACDHKLLWNYHSLSQLLVNAGFEVEVLEYWNDNKQFLFRKWDPVAGNVLRSYHNDDRNNVAGGVIGYTSLIIDAKKPGGKPEGLVRAIRMRQIEGVFYVNIDDYISTIDTAIDLNKDNHQLSEAIREVKLFMLQLSAELEQKGLDEGNQYPEEKLVNLDGLIKDMKEEIDRTQGTLRASAHTACIDVLLQLALQKDNNTQALEN